MEARSLTQAHIDECKREREITRRNFEAMQKDFEDKHMENKVNRAADKLEFKAFYDSFQSFQKKLLLFAIVVLASLVLKGTKLDLITQLLSTL